MADYLVALRDQLDLLADLDDCSGVLVAQCHRERLGDVLLPHSLDDMVVSLTPPGSFYRDDNVVAVFYLRLVDFVN